MVGDDITDDDEVFDEVDDVIDEVDDVIDDDVVDKEDDVGFLEGIVSDDVTVCEECTGWGVVDGAIWLSWAVSV